MDTVIMSGEEGIRYGAELIKKGEIVAFPTETVYGLGGNALDERCVEKIYAAKGRPQDNPLIVHVSSIQDIDKITAEFSERNRRVAERFMPGPITLLFPRGQAISPIVTAGLDTVGVRIPANPIARQFISRCGVPIAAPSANRSTRISPTTARHVYEDMAGRIPLIIDGGASDIGIESTVLDLTGEIPTILRPGAITADMLLEVLDSVRTHKGQVINAAPAPGMKYKHYAPRVDFIVAESVQSLIKEYDRVKEKGCNPIALIPDKYAERLENRRRISLGKDDAEVCRNIYRAMHEAQDTADYIVCLHLGNDGINASVMNRVMKAAGGRTV